MLFVCFSVTASLAAWIALFVILFSFEASAPQNGHVVAKHSVPDDYGFGSDRRLLVFNLTRYKTLLVEDDEGERGLNGIEDIHPSIKRYASLTVYKNGTVYNQVENRPIALDQKGGWRPQLNIGFEIRKMDDVTEEDDLQLLDSFPEDMEDYFIRGCYYDPSCTRDFVPVVAEVTPKMKGELFEVLFWQDETYTYEGVYGLFPKIRRKYYDKTVDTWTTKGKVNKDTPCDDTLREVGIAFESEVERVDRSTYNSFERLVQADMVYPSSSNEAYFLTMQDQCVDKFNQAVDWFTVPNLENETVVDLDIPSFVKFYLTSQLVRQVDFGFAGVQQFYYKVPGTTLLSTGPPYDFDSQWELTLVSGYSPLDIAVPHSHADPSPLWSALGRDSSFASYLKRNGSAHLHNTMRAVRSLYEERMSDVRSGYFERHEERWPVRGRVPDLIHHFFELGKEAKGIARETMYEEMAAHLRIYETRYENMLKGIESIEGKDVAFKVVIQDLTPLILEIAWIKFWWAFVFGLGGVLVGCLVCCGAVYVHFFRKSSPSEEDQKVKTIRKANVISLERLQEERRRRR